MYRQYNKSTVNGLFLLNFTLLLFLLTSRSIVLIDIALLLFLLNNIIQLSTCVL